MPYNVMTPELKNQIWLMYLRKSRQDDPNETVEEVLAKHEAILQEWAKRELGHEIPDEDIFREIISGESLEDRVEVQRLLARIEEPRVVGVIVVEPQRLSRGDLEDCGKLISTLRYTHTLVATPMMTYDMDNKMERRFFQDELMRGRDFLEYTKEILYRGRVAAVKRGCFIGSKVPFGYDKVKLGKDHTLVPNENAEYVRLMFDMYVNQNKIFSQITAKLNELGISSPSGIEWKKDTVRKILANPHYDGKVFFNSKKVVTVVENGMRITRRLTQPEEEVIIAEGKHPAIIDHETFQRAQDRLKLNPPNKSAFVLNNPLSGILKCKTCGYSVVLHPYQKGADRLECRGHHFKSAKASEVTAALLSALELSELPQLESKLHNGDGKAIVIQQRILDKLEKQMDEYRAQEEKQYDLLETGKYTQELFDKRNAALRQKMESCQEQIYETKRTMPTEVDYEERIMTLKKAIAGMKDEKLTANEKNRLLKAIIERVDMTTIDLGFKNTEIKLEVFLRM